MTALAVVAGMLLACAPGRASTGSAPISASRVESIHLLTQAAALTQAVAAAKIAAVNSNSPGGGRVLVQTPLLSVVLGIVRALGITLLDSDSESGVYLLTTPLGLDANTFARILSLVPLVAAAEPDLPTSLPENGEAMGQAQSPFIHMAFDGGGSGADPLYGCIGASPEYNQQAYQQVDLGNAQDIAQGTGVTVAVLDTGVMSAHPNLAPHLVSGYNAIAPGTVPEDVADGTTNIALGHGTMITGVIVRLAPGAKVMPVRVLNGDGTGSLLNLIRGVEFAVDHGARVLNMSLDTAQYSLILQLVLGIEQLKGVVVVAAAGNQGTSVPHYPAAYPGVIGVAAVDTNDTKADFSNFASNALLVAPGVGICSTYINGGYATWSGTSFSAPFVTATAAMVLSARPWLTLTSVPCILANTGRSLNMQNPGYAGQLGYGELDIARAVLRATSP